MGTYHAPNTTTPSTILVQPGEIDEYTLDIEAVTAVGDSQPVLASEAMLVQCARQDQSTFESGVAWRPAAGGELRVLLPDQPGEMDATQRPLDLDCDAHEVTAGDSSDDCDDTRPHFHRDATDVCDGMDTNCDGARFIAVDC